MCVFEVISIAGSSWCRAGQAKDASVAPEKSRTLIGIGASNFRVRLQRLLGIRGKNLDGSMRDNLLGCVSKRNTTNYKTTHLLSPSFPGGIYQQVECDVPVVVCVGAWRRKRKMMSEVNNED